MSDDVTKQQAREDHDELMKLGVRMTSFEKAGDKIEKGINELFKLNRDNQLITNQNATNLENHIKADETAQKLRDDADDKADDKSESNRSNNITVAIAVIGFIYFLVDILK